MELLIKSKISLVINVCYMILAMFMIVGTLSGNEKASIGLAIVCVSWVTLQIIAVGFASIRALSIKNALEKNGVKLGSGEDIIKLINDQIKDEKKNDD